MLVELYGGGGARGAVQVAVAEHLARRLAIGQRMISTRTRL